MSSPASYTLMHPDQSVPENMYDDTHATRRRRTMATRDELTRTLGEIQSRLDSLRGRL